MGYFTGPASTSNYGVVKIGNGITVANGIISTSGGGGSTIGTWTPVVVSSLGATITLVTKNSNYAKIGQYITCTFDFTIATETGGGSGGIITIQGLPFTSITETNGGYVGGVYISYFSNMGSDTGWLSGGVVNNTKIADMFFGGSQPKSLSNLTQDDIKVTTRLVGTITYLSSS